MDRLGKKKEKTKERGEIRKEYGGKVWRKGGRKKEKGRKEGWAKRKKE